jgi:NADPH-dependent 2,4-dienoyl-CoA reductase/sulfur reductase-like enzyme
MKKVVIVGGVAGGASTAARLRRLREDLEIIVLERGPYVSFANCGLPYYIGHVIKDQSLLELMTPEDFWDRFKIDVRINNEAISINRDKKTISVKNLEKDNLFELEYDYLVLSPGASPIMPQFK